jgi:RimJ/RimL family protein N-acetyltransferase
MRLLLRPPVDHPARMPAPLSAPTLTDGVVTLRAHRTDDVPRIVEQARDPESIAWTTVPVPYGEDDARAYALGVLPKGWVDGDEWAFAVELEGRYAGTVTLRNEGPGRAEIAFASHPDARGTGAIERGCRLLVEWGFAELELETIVWRAFTGNWASRKLAWRLGFTQEGTLRGYLPQRDGGRHDAWVGTLLRNDPREPRTTWLDVPVIEGDGFRLRPVRDDDAPRIQEGTAEPAAQHWLGHKPAPYTMDDARAYVERRREHAATAQAVTWAVADADDDRILGTVLWFNWVPEVECELGFWLHPEARGRGLATRACTLALDHVFDTLGVQRVTAFAAAANTASRAVIERLGFRFYGIERYGANVRDGWVDMALYDVTASEWAAAGARSCANPMASTANPASDSSTPTASGDR